MLSVTVRSTVKECPVGYLLLSGQWLFVWLSITVWSTVINRPVHCQRPSSRLSMTVRSTVHVRSAFYYSPVNDLLVYCQCLSDLLSMTVRRFRPLCLRRHRWIRIFSEKWFGKQTHSCASSTREYTSLVVNNFTKLKKKAKKKMRKLKKKLEENIRKINRPIKWGKKKQGSLRKSKEN